jgi:hypothetical protein
MCYIKPNKKHNKICCGGTVNSLIYNMVYTFQFYRDGMLRELGVTRRLVDNLFPQLDDLIFVHMNFYHQLQDLQNRRPDRLVEEIGPALKEQVLLQT